MKRAWRALECGPGAGDWNMAVDEVLMQSSAASRECSLRFYGWIEPTVSLGYFQNYGSRREHAASRQCALVRRATGGGAIVHDRELTYSLAAPADHPLAKDAQQLYRLLHQSLIDVLSQWGVRARLCDVGSSVDRDSEPFLCFQRRSIGDVLVGNDKIAGSAQRRRRGAVLQHGSVLCERSGAAPELPGLAELSGKAIDRAELATAWRARLAEQCQIEYELRPIEALETSQAHERITACYGASSWTHRR